MILYDFHTALKRCQNNTNLKLFLWHTHEQFQPVAILFLASTDSYSYQ